MIRTIFMGTPEFSLESLRYLYENTDLRLVVTKEDKINSRGNKINYSPVKEFAIEHNIEYLQPKSLKNDETYEYIKSFEPELIVVAAYGKIIPRRLIDLPKYGIINVHSSILPKYRGSSPIHHALLNGDKKTGLTIMLIDEGLDTGDILEVEEVDIDEKDNLATLTEKLSNMSYGLLDKTIKKILSGTITRTKQDDAKAVVVSLIKKSDCLLDFNLTKEQIYNKVRAFNPTPTAYILKGSEHIKVYEVEKIDKEYEGKMGQVVEITKKGPIVKCLNGAVRLKSVKFEGKKIQSGADIVNGRKVLLGDVFYGKES